MADAKVEILVPRYSPAEGIRTIWDTGFQICVSVEGTATRVVANQAGLRSLARHLLALADDHMPEGRHIHLDAENSLEEDSTELILERS